MVDIFQIGVRIAMSSNGTQVIGVLLRDMAKVEASAVSIRTKLGLVGDPVVLARQLAEKLGLALWDGTVEESGRLAFVGDPARTFILAPPGRGWLPTGRAAEPHPVEALIAGRKNAEVELEHSRYRIRSISGGSPSDDGV